ncbi:hypothetical protein F2P81_019788 [Scophthalmus maximus]|uniref:Uncharacterized protein n=1 Tax=Scophthalmus maximus TaxID=52904 RepID=A0A6A4S222_SCOMX|nr:hypothetical protein F2P81_019788 [Scophthalmus maximus]
MVLLESMSDALSQVLDRKSEIALIIIIIFALFIWLINSCRQVFLYRSLSRMMEHLPIDLTPPHEPDMSEGEVNGPQQLSSGYCCTRFSS